MNSDILKVELNEAEQQLYSSICWGSHDEFMKLSYETRIQMFENLGLLTESLLSRKVIPDHRLSYFTDPELNFGGRGKSRKDVFEKNGTSGRAIFRHPHFMDYLQYFINGPRLPIAAMHGLWKILDDDAGTSGMLLNQIQAYVRKQVRELDLPSHLASDEFLKLALEYHRPDMADIVRKAAMTAR